MSDQATRVYHVRRDPYDQYVGRPVPRYPDLHATGWGNPFRDWQGGRSPIEQYRDWVLRQPQLLARQSELRGKRLGCWCAPRGGLPANLFGSRCHGEVLAALADLPPEEVKALRKGVV